VRVKRLVIAIDGPAGAGKSSAARLLARRLGYALLDTGAIYRALALVAAERGVPFTDGAELAALARTLDVRFRFDGERNRVALGERDVSDAIRRPEMGEGASQVSHHPEVRAALLDLQRRLGQSGGVVAEGRDTGTVVFPDAEVKVFLTASDETRARRRYEEEQARGRAVELDEVLREQRARDQRDSTRQAAPLRQAEDALYLDSSALTLDEVVERVARVVAERSEKG
jgi:cytidylate kinase